MTRVVPLRTMLYLVVLWAAIDIIDLGWLHFSSLTLGEIALKSEWMIMVALVGYWVAGKRKVELPPRKNGWKTFRLFLS